MRDAELSKELVLLAESRGQVLSDSRLELYCHDLADLPLEPLVRAIRDWRRQGSQFFPQAPELRAKVNPPANEDAEAEVAWQQCERHVKRYYHPDRGIRGPWNSVTRGYNAVPRLDERTDRAMRAIGGPLAIWNQMDLGEGTNDAYPFVKRDFIAAWKLAPAVELADAKALASGPGQKLLGEVQALAQAKRM